MKGFRIQDKLDGKRFQIKFYKPKDYEDFCEVLQKLREEAKESYLELLQQEEKSKTKSYKMVKLQQDLRKECLELSEIVEGNITVYWAWLEE